MKLNLHLHTEYSDGRDTMATMARVAKEEGHVCLVTSDHDYCMTEEKYTKQCAEAEVLAKEMDFPIICGLEISMWSEEAVLIGRKACQTWLEFRASRKLKTWDEVFRFHPPLADIKEVLSHYPYGLCLVHPGCGGEDDLYKMFDCHEIMNGRHEWPIAMQELIAKRAPQSRPVRGLDAHSADGCLKDPRCICNEVSAGAWNEIKIIEWMKTRLCAHFKHVHCTFMLDLETKLPALCDGRDFTCAGYLETEYEVLVSDEKWASNPSHQICTRCR